MKLGRQLTKQWFYGTGIAPLAEADGAGTIRMRFVYGSKSNVPDVVKTYTSAGAADKLYRVSTDQLGTPRVIVDAAGTIFEATDYDEFGIKLSDTNPTFEFPFGFAGGLYDADTKLTRFGARDYDASIGRWISKDPILFGGRQANLYVYVQNDPINWIDPSGLYFYSTDAKGVLHRTWDEWETQRLMDEAITDYSQMGLASNLCAAAINSSRLYDGRYDFKVDPFYKGDFFSIPGVGIRNASSFGNYFAGYVNYASLGHQGTNLTHVGGWMSHQGPGDDATSTELIDRGEFDARQRFHGWGGPPERFGNGG